MPATATEKTFSVHQYFAGKNVLVTGSTGFLAKALVAKILRDLPEVPKVFLLIRPRARADGSLIDPSERLREEILRNSAFGRLREEMGTRFESWCQEKIVCVAGDLTHARLGLDEAAFEELAGQVQVAINSAATVVFDERLDLALEMNTLSPLRLLDLCHAGGAAYLHISTAYVSGMRKGSVPERLMDPLEAIDAQLAPGLERPAKFDTLKEIERLKTLAKIVTSDCETQARRKGWAPESEEAQTELRRSLVAAGMRRARSLGWNDTYTYTKFLGEQLVWLRHGDTPTAILRPSIIESSLRDPEPGWLDGLRMADPLIVGFGKGRLADFPANRNVVLDIIPADLVVNAILSAAAHLGEKRGAFDLLHVATSAENPLGMENLYQAVRDYFQRHPMLDREGRPVRVPQWKFPTVERFKRRVTNRYLRPIRVFGALVDGPVPVPGTRGLRARLRTLNNSLEQLLYYVDIYSPYTNLDCRFETSRARAILERLDPEERECFGFDPRSIRWRHYIQDVHIPGLKRNILRMESPPRAGAGEGKLLEEEARRGQARSAPAIRGVPQTIVELAARGADLFGGMPFLEMRHGSVAGRLTYGEFFERAGDWARRLRARLDLQPGDRVVLWSENCPEWGLAYVAIARAGATAVPLDRQMPAAEALRLAHFVEAKAAIVSPAILSSQKGAADSGWPTRLNLLSDLDPLAGDAWPSPDASEDVALKEPAPEALASILFTSGTTYQPKGVMLTHANFASNALSVAEVLEPLTSDRFLSLLPLHHAFEFTGGFLVPMFGGSNVHYVETLRKEEILETMKRAGITVVLAVPRLYQLFATGIRAKLEEAGAGARVAVSVMDSVAGAAEWMGSEQARKKVFKKVHEAFGGKLRLFVSGGAALDPEVFLFFRRFGIAIAEGYGLTETAPILTVNPLGAPKPGSVGLTLPGVELNIKDPDARGVGEVLARGPMVMRGYWNEPDATEQVFEDGWFKTGDLGRFDSEGYLFLTGRLKDVIITAAGKNVYPDEIETHFRETPGVKELCAIGLPARKGHGEEVALIVVPKSPGAKSRDAVLAAIEKTNKGLPSHQRVARIEFQDHELPKTSTLKVQRVKVRERYVEAARPASAKGKPAKREKAAAAKPGKTRDAFAEVARAVAEIAEVDADTVRPNQKLQLDLGIDSIGRVDLVGKLELRLGVTISDEDAGTLWTVQDVLAAVESGAKTPRPAADAGEPALARRLKESPAPVWKAGDPLAPSMSKSLIQGAFSTSAKVFFNTWLRIDGYGLENLPSSGAYILAANHSSHLDTAAVREVLGGRAASLHVMGAKDYFFDTRLKSWFFSTLFNALPFEREENVMEGLVLCRRVLESGKALLIFPEGTRSVSGRLQPFKAGIGVLAVELDYPVVPVHLSGTYESLPKGRAIPRPSRLCVRFGPPVDFSSLKRKSGKSKGGDGKGASGTMEQYREAASLVRAGVERLTTGA